MKTIGIAAICLFFVACSKSTTSSHVSEEELAAFLRDQQDGETHQTYDVHIRHVVDGKNASQVVFADVVTFFKDKSKSQEVNKLVNGEIRNARSVLFCVVKKNEKWAVVHLGDSRGAECDYVLMDALDPSRSLKW